jgi:Flp pilus assembly protein protease CpaA
MNQDPQSDWVGSTVAVAICCLTALVSPRISLPVALAAMVGMAIYYRRRSHSWIGAGVALVGAAVIAMAIAFLLATKRFH